MDVTIPNGVSVSPKAPFDEGSTKTTRVVVATRKKQKIKGHYSPDNWHLYLAKAIARDNREGSYSNLL